MTGERDDWPEGKRKILQAAVEIFAERGYDRTTIREIVARAGAGLGAVNYHFRDKQGLYRETLLYASGLAHEQTRAAVEGYPPAEALERWIAAVLHFTLATGPDRWAIRIFLYDVSDEGGRIRREIEGVIAQRSVGLIRPIVAQLIGRPEEDERTTIATLGLIGSVIVFDRPRERVGPHVLGRPLGPADVPALARQLAAIFLAGFERIRSMPG
jgi:TetR/AcrR family transcriptional regulator, regulator of cefoperazone and chloramphenicol sensitivity